MVSTDPDLCYLTATEAIDQFKAKKLRQRKTGKPPEKDTAMANNAHHRGREGARGQHAVVGTLQTTVVETAKQIVARTR